MPCNMTKMQELEMLFAEKKKAKDIIKLGLSTYSKSNIYWHERRFKSGKTRFIIVKVEIGKQNRNNVEEEMVKKE